MSVLKSSSAPIFGNDLEVIVYPITETSHQAEQPANGSDKQNQLSFRVLIGKTRRQRSEAFPPRPIEVETVNTGMNINMNGCPVAPSFLKPKSNGSNVFVSQSAVHMAIAMHNARPNAWAVVRPKLRKRAGCAA